MATTTLLLVLLIVLCATGASTAFPGSGNAGPADLVAELELLRSRSPSGVIRLDDAAVARFLTSPQPSSRPYSFVIFFDAASFHSKPELRLPDLRAHFGLVSASFTSRNAGSPRARSSLFFADIEYGQSPSSFAAFGISSLPHIRLVPAGAKSLRDDFVAMDQSHFAQLADSMAEFVESHTGLLVRPIDYPPPFSRPQIATFAVLIVVSLPFAIKRVISGDTLLHDIKVWAIGAIFVYFFSVAGSMYGIIRNAPFLLTDRDDPKKHIFFYQGSGMQLGAEGFAVGLLYTSVGLMVAVATHWLVRVKNLNLQRSCMLFVMMVSYWMVREVIRLDNWKTGYGVHLFWPRSWR